MRLIPIVGLAEMYDAANINLSNSTVFKQTFGKNDTAAFPYFFRNVKILFNYKTTINNYSSKHHSKYKGKIDIYVGDLLLETHNISNRECTLRNFKHVYYPYIINQDIFFKFSNCKFDTYTIVCEMIYMPSFIPQLICIYSPYVSIYNNKYKYMRLTSVDTIFCNELVKMEKPKPKLLSDDILVIRSKCWESIIYNVNNLDICYSLKPPIFKLHNILLNKEKNSCIEEWDLCILSKDEIKWRIYLDKICNKHNGNLTDTARNKKIYYEIYKGSHIAVTKTDIISQRRLIKLFAKLLNH